MISLLFAARTVHDTFKRDLEQGFKTRDKVYAIDLLGKALVEDDAKSLTAAPIIADMFSSSVLFALSSKPPRAYLYVWERKALEWLREWRKTDNTTPICAWTQSYINYGPPPWGDKP